MEWLHPNGRVSVRGPRLVAIFSKHTGHSAPAPCCCLLAPAPVLVAFGISDRVIAPKRVVPAGIDEDDGRASYLAIAKRSQTEGSNLYAVLAIGSQMFMASQKLKNAAGAGV